MDYNKRINYLKKEDLQLKEELKRFNNSLSVLVEAWNYSILERNL